MCASSSWATGTADILRVAVIAAPRFDPIFVTVAGIPLAEVQRHLLVAWRRGEVRGATRLRLGLAGRQQGEGRQEGEGEEARAPSGAPCEAAQERAAGPVANAIGDRAGSVNRHGALHRTLEPSGLGGPEAPPPGRRPRAAGCVTSGAALRGREGPGGRGGRRAGRRACGNARSAGSRRRRCRSWGKGSRPGRAAEAQMSPKAPDNRWRSALGARRSALGARRSALGARRSALNSRARVDNPVNVDSSRRPAAESASERSAMLPCAPSLVNCYFSPFSIAVSL